MKLPIMHRADLFRTAFASVLLTVAPTPPAVAYDMETTLALTSLLQLRGYVSDIDVALFEDLMQQKPPSGVKVVEGELTRSRIKKLLRTSAALPRAVLSNLPLQKLIGRQNADAALLHGREVEERLAAILEFDASNALKKDALNTPIQLMRPDELAFYHRALMSAQSEIDQTLTYFGDEEQREAVRFLARGEPAAKIEASRREAALREAAVAAAIRELPDTTGTTLFRGDLQNSLNNQWQDDIRSGRTSLPEPDE